MSTYRNDPSWRHKPLTPGHLLVQDVGLETLGHRTSPRLEIKDVPTSSFASSASSLADEKGTNLFSNPPPLGSTRVEEHRLADIQRAYGWLKSVRLDSQLNENTSCRWIHIASKFPEYLQGIFVGLSDFKVDPEGKLECLRQLDRAIYDFERYSKHGKYFSPFIRRLSISRSSNEDDCPMLISLPFLDWTVNGQTPPLRFQIDDREGRQSDRASSHPLRSLLQHYYRLENTTDRERLQVFAKHRPWHEDRDAYLKIRQWFGYYPTGLVVDNIWLLIVDSRHIVTFSSNQTWKSRWPPMQLTSRISDVSFRRIRDNFFRSERTPKYTAHTHAISCLHGAVGMLHRSFYPDMPIPISDRFGGYLSTLQYRLHRSASTKLVTDLLQIQDELKIVLGITRQQEEVLEELRGYVGSSLAFTEDSPQPAPPHQRERPALLSYDGNGPSRESETQQEPVVQFPRRNYTFQPLNPLDEIIDLLRRESVDLKELLDSSTELITRTVQLVNIRLEDHGRAILVFTVVTIVFLPLSFIASYFGMNVRGIRDTHKSEETFWIIAAVVTICILILSVLLAFYGGTFQDKFYSSKKVRFWNRTER